MLPIIEKLLVLQDRDRKILRLRAELEGIEPLKKYQKDRGAKAQNDFDNFKKSFQHLESERKRLELEVASKKQLIDKCRTQQGQTKKNDEYRAFQHQIETTENEIHGIEDQQLELMEKLEAVEKEVAAASQVARAAKAEVDQALKEIAERESNLKRDLEVVSQDRATLAQGIDETTRTRYERLLKNKGENIVVGVDHGICGGCHMKLTTQLFLGAKAQQEIVHCLNCNRILYFAPGMEGPSANDR